MHRLTVTHTSYHAEVGRALVSWSGAIVACCAFVAFLFSQLYMMGRGLKRLFGRGRHDEVDAATLWRLNTNTELASQQVATPDVNRKRSQLKRAGLVVAVAAEVAIVVVAAHWLLVGDGVERVAAELQHLASGHGLAHLRELINP